MKAKKASRHRESRQTLLGARRGSLVTLRRAPEGGTGLAIVVSNDMQNEASEYVVVVPLEKRPSRLRAPFAVDLGRSDGLRTLHTARCDWVTRVKVEDIRSIERARLSSRVLDNIEAGLLASLGMDDR